MVSLRNCLGDVGRDLWTVIGVSNQPHYNYNPSLLQKFHRPKRFRTI